MVTIPWIKYKLYENIMINKADLLIEMNLPYLDSKAN